MNENRTHLSEFELARLLLPESATHEVSAHLAACAECRERLALATASAETFRAEVFPRTLPRVRDRVAGSARRPWQWPTLVFAAASVAMVALLFVVFPRGGDGSSTVIEPGVGFFGEPPVLIAKGAPQLEVFGLRDGRVFPVSNGERMFPGDRIRFVVTSAELRYLLIASIDAVGKVSVYHPYDGAESALVPDSGRVELPGSIVLDDTLGPERIYGLFSSAPVPADRVVGALESIRAGDHRAIRTRRHLDGRGELQVSLLIEKEVAP